MFYSKKLKKFKKIRHCFFSKKGGYSKGLYKSLNCGKGSSDSKFNVQKNLRYVSKKMKVSKKKLILMYQTHSNKVVEIKRSNLEKRIKSDAIITRIKGIALGVVTADCVPILIYEKNTNTIASIHAGWKGAISGIIENTIKKIKENSSAKEIFACIGPCIGKKNYEVDQIFYRRFISISKNNRIYFSKKNKLKKNFNLRKYVHDKLLKLKVKVDHVNHDTFAENNNFFSYRRSQILREIDYGRCISVISLL